MYSIIIKNNKYFPKIRKYRIWFSLYYDGKIISLLNRLKIYPYTYPYDGCPHNTIEGALAIIKKNKQLTIKNKNYV